MNSYIICFLKIALVFYIEILSINLMSFLISQGTWNKDISTQANSSWSWIRRSTKWVHNKWCRVRNFRHKIWIAFWFKKSARIYSTCKWGHQHTVQKWGSGSVWERTLQITERVSEIFSRWFPVGAIDGTTKAEKGWKATMNDKEEFV